MTRLSGAPDTSKSTFPSSGAFRIGRRHETAFAIVAILVNGNLVAHAGRMHCLNCFDSQRAVKYR
jgi:hypothetical protein